MTPGCRSNDNPRVRPRGTFPGTLPAVWAFADIANGLMAVPNLISLLALSGVVVAETRLYLWSGNLDRAGDEPALAAAES